MQLIIEHNIKVRMKFPDQRAALEKLRKEMAVGKDTVVTHKPTPELNRNTPEQPAVPDPVQEKEATQSPASPVALKHQPSAPSLHHHRLNTAKRQMRHKVKNHRENFARERA